jgi:hypothetical protein
MPNEDVHVYSSTNIIRMIDQGGRDGKRETREMHARFWWETLKETHHLEDQTPVGGIILKWTLRKMICTGLMRLKMGAT